jgi:hypothetical protein
MITKDELIEAARKAYGTEGIEIDSDAEFTEADGGVWVQAWVWMGDDDV